MSYVNLIIKRSISTSSIREGKRNFKKFSLHNKRGSRIFKQMQAENPDPEMPIDKRGVRDVGYTLNGTFYTVPEMIPELIVPDLKDFKLKPYVSYRAPEIYQEELTAQTLFDVVYAPKIKKDHTENKLSADGNPMEPSVQEKQTSEEAWNKAKMTGSELL
ncbi:PREDICTED: 39S ribosomal protein L41, mitochondrial [Nicrophorus vespilloides]|uniref:39S ribosomal protein L41, mitochondrial n=1 Tax=Nicrophorus vespilloides TaxID=110193 RepID=A0ABM1MKQ5_NICVS|nr:PREDICTED: 39S ribosomal protein L41, mitochondrial [Nicrophorus vespilloides]